MTAAKDCTERCLHLRISTIFLLQFRGWGRIHVALLTCCLKKERRSHKALDGCSSPLLHFFLSFLSFFSVRSSKQADLCVRKTLSSCTMREGKCKARPMQNREWGSGGRTFVCWGNETVVSVGLSVLLTLHSLGQSFSRKTDR